MAARNPIDVAVIAPESRLESVVKAAARVVDSVEFHVR